MASRLRRRLLQDPTESSEQMDWSRSSPVHSSALWWENTEEQSDREDSLREHLNVMDDHVHRLQEMLKYERTKSSRLQLRCNQQDAELKRKEQNITRLKEKLTDKHKVPTIKILNTVSRARGNGEKSTVSKQEEGAVRLMLERREAELSEAMRLRHSLTSLLHALKCEMEQGCKEGIFCVDKRLDQAERTLGDHVTGGVVQSWRQVQKNLGIFTNKAESTDHDKLVTQLRSELNQSQQLVLMQQQLLENSIGSPVHPELADSYFMEERGRLREQWIEFKLQKRTFEKEREAFTDAAIRLSRERQNFEHLKASHLKHQFLCDSPEFGRGAKSNSRREIGLNFSGVKPLNNPESAMAYTPATVFNREVVSGCPDVVRVMTPSTPELYSALGLSFR